MGKTLVIAEKPSVGRDLAGALPGSFKQSKDMTHLEGDEYVISWAVGHLVGLAAPDEYDPKLKRWRFADLPIVPDKFKLVPVDERSKKQLQAAARSRSEADWVVGMNATRAASIRLRAAFDGAVSLGRVQSPTLALVARREEEIRDFKPEPYWLLEARFAAGGERNYLGRYLGGKRLGTEDE